ncbi:hypothetical protein PZB74_03595 [Porifericola rhodea]|uniref:hypothetical protein n=1 Tax=Porifericola rhodea TaxID=930972 RepID=UPI0026658396|nr:hypothetical protein [Porifericola rhodea]WKN32430.1 hypothetical protein PZB74_03595 [Porifericola rhodea]
MKKLTDEEIQRLLDQGLEKGEQARGEDQKMYQLLYKALEEEPQGGLSWSFADKVSRKAVQLHTRQQVKKYWLWMSLSILLALTSCAACLFIFEQELASIMVNYLIELRWVVIFAAIMFFLIQLADYYFIPRQQSYSEYRD